MLPRPVREVARAHSDDQAALAEEAVGVVAGIASRARQPEQWRDSVARIGSELLLLQVAAVAVAEGYVTDVLDAQGADATAEAEILPKAWEDFTDGGGSWLLNLVYAVNAIPKVGRSSSALQSQVEDLAASIVLSGMHDAARSAVQASSLTRPGAHWYVRMLRGKSCARCAILAGRRYRSVSPFRRHNHCDCIQVPAHDEPDDWTVDPTAYFRSLSIQDQDRIFGKASAQVIRDSGVSQLSLNQVVNARQGISTVTSFGREVRVTTTGTTIRGTFGGYEALSDGTLRKRSETELQKLPTGRYRRAKTPRLLPDEIYLLAEEFGWDRAATLNQLRRFAYIT